jgi:Arc/MetJ family transcription regulator
MIDCGRDWLGELERLRPDALVLTHGHPTIEIDDDLLNRAKEALGEATARATVEEALRRAAAGTEVERKRRATKQRRYLEQLSLRVDVSVLASEEMWR